MIKKLHTNWQKAEINKRYGEMHKWEWTVKKFAFEMRAQQWLMSADVEWAD